MSRPTGQLVSTQANGEIWAVQAGKGPDVVLLAGLGDTHEVWQDVLEPLSVDHRVTVLDNRGVGHSPLGHEALSLELFARDALDVMSQWQVSRAHVVGSSMGGAIAQQLALRRPGAVRSLALVGTWARPDPHLMGLLRHMSWLVSTMTDPRALMEAMALWVYSGEAHANGTVQRLICAALAADGPEQSAEAFAVTAEAAVAHDLGGRLSAIVAPTLIAVGGEDRICPLRLSMELRASLGSGMLRVLPGRGHQPFQEDPQEFLGMLREFWVTV